MSTTRPRPPRLAEWLLRRVLPSDARGASILGDLLEEFQAEADAGARGARSVAARRYWLRTLSVGSRFVFARVVRRPRVAATAVLRDDLPAPRRASMGFGMLEEDVRYALRALLRTPTFTIIALATLALGIGASTAIFSLAYAVLLRPLPYADPDRLVFIHERTPRVERTGVAWPNYVDWHARATSFEELAATRADAVNISGDRPERLDARMSTWNFFRVLRVEPVLGRLFLEADGRADAAPVVVISHELWVRNYGANTSIVGQTLSIEHRPYTIIGVLPPGFQFIGPADVYRPIEPLAGNFRWMLSRGDHGNLYAVGRLKASVTVEQARAEVEGIAAGLAREYPNTNTRIDAVLVPLADYVVARIRATFIVLAVSVALLLMIACVNLANLLLARGSSRSHELAIRAALGGSRWRLVRQLLVEQTVLVGIGAALGALAGRVLLQVLIALAPHDIPRINEVRLNDMVLLYTAAASALCALTFGLIPALNASRVRGQELLVRTGRTAHLSTARVRRGLTIAEIAVATVLVAASGLMVRTMLRLVQADPGFDPRDLLTLSIELDDHWRLDKRYDVFDAIVQRLRALPGIESAGLTASLPIDGSRWNTGFIAGDKPVPPRAELPGAAFTPVSTGYFQTMKIRLLRGRLFDRTENASSPRVAVINETLARTMWPGEDPIGKRLKHGWPEDPRPWRTVVGVVADVKTDGIERNTPMQIYVPIVHEPAECIVVVRGEHIDRMATAVSTALREFGKDMPIYAVATMDQVMADEISRQRVSMVVLSVFGAVALLLAMIGLYSVITHGVTERTQEIGLRMALGATDGQVLRLFLQQGLLAATCGIALGVAAALGLTRWLETLLFGVTATDATTFATVVAVLVIVAAAACYVPARRAARVDPLIALRWE